MENRMSTPHISAKLGDIAPDVILPGDPLRAERIAETVLENARVVSAVRGNRIFTGVMNGRPTSVMASGMGMPSTALYATELFRFYDVNRIVRIGTCAAISANVRVRDIVIATGAHTDSAMWEAVPGLHISHIADSALLTAAAAAQERAPAKVRLGAVFSTDTFYGIPEATRATLAELGTLAVDMEAAALYTVAAREGGSGLAVLTVSGDAHESLSAADRESAFQEALTVVELALSANSREESVDSEAVLR